ncbi:hypothetical protein KAZ01_01780 [Candidatus Gracilibacteria bacterium]|nr:hypothetical protein [Candidatus Gracilibacteria bacterium]
MKYHGKLIFTCEDDKSFFNEHKFECLKRIKENNQNSFIWITYNINYTKEIKRFFLDNVTNNILPFFPVFTFKQILDLILERLQIFNTPVNTLIYSIIMQDVISESNNLKILNKYKDKKFPGLIDYISSTIEMAKYSNIPFTQYDCPFNIDADLWEDIFYIYSEMNKKLSDLGLTDKVSNDLAVFENLKNNPGNRIFRNTDLLICEPTPEMNSLHLKILLQIFMLIPNIFLHIPYNTNSKVHKIYNDLFDFFKNNANFQVINTAKCKDIEKHLSDNLFQTNINIDKNIAHQINDKVSIVKCIDKGNEIEFICGYIKEHIIEKNNDISLSDIIISTPSLNNYIQIIEETLSRYKIPWCSEIYFPLISSPITCFLINLFQFILNNYHKNYFEYIFDFSCINKKTDFQNNESLIFSRSLIEKISKRSSISEGRDNWLNEISLLIKDLENLKINGELENRNFNSSYDDIDKEIVIFKNIKKYLEDFFNLSKKLENKLSPYEFNEFFNDLLSFLNFPNFNYKYVISKINLENKAQIIEDTSLIMIERKTRSYIKLKNILDQITYALSKISNKKLELSEYFNFFINEIKKSGITYTHKAKGGVRIIPLEQSVFYTPKITFIAGFHFDNFPRIKNENPFLLYSSFNNDVSLSKRELQIDKDKYIFYKILTSSVIKTIFTYPEREKEKIYPSSFLDEIKMIYNLEEKNPNDLISVIPKNMTDLLNYMTKKYNILKAMSAARKKILFSALCAFYRL